MSESTAPCQRALCGASRKLHTPVRHAPSLCERTMLVRAPLERASGSRKGSWRRLLCDWRERRPYRIAPGRYAVSRARRQYVADAPPTGPPSGAPSPLNKPKNLHGSNPFCCNIRSTIVGMGRALAGGLGGGGMAVCLSSGALAGAQRLGCRAYISLAAAPCVIWAPHGDVSELPSTRDLVIRMSPELDLPSADGNVVILLVLYQALAGRQHLVKHSTIGWGGVLGGTLVRGLGVWAAWCLIAVVSALAHPNTDFLMRYLPHSPHLRRSS